ncbi:MAG: sensor histidine kinase [Planctomycetota bacterium]|jgi:signal transduction histidine kinase
MERALARSRGAATSQAPDKDDGSYVSDNRRVDELQAVLAISQALTGKVELDRVLGVAVGVVADILGAEGSSVLLIDPETGGMSFHVAAGPGAKLARTVPLPPGAGICGYVVRSGEPLILNDAQNDPRLYKQVDNKTGITTRNLLCVPLHSKERMWGVLEVINKHRDNDFDERDLRIADAIGTQIALALENAHLHGEIVRKERMAAIGQTVSGLAHCVKNILNGIRSGSVVIDRHLKEDNFDKVREGWDVVRKNNNMLGNLVLDMLSMAKETKFNPFPTDVNDLANQICKLVTDRAAGRGVEVIFTPAENLPEVMTDPTQFYRALLNLVSNAVEACDKGNHIRVRIYRAADKPRATISVTDDGMGISPENQRKLFTEFFTTKGNQGTGLGLPVTKKLINGMGGTIKFHSVVERGTKFVIALPVDKETNS